MNKTNSRLNFFLNTLFLLLIIFTGCSGKEIIVTPWDRLRDNPDSQQRLRVEPSDCGIRFNYPVDSGFEMWYTDVFCPDGKIVMIYFKIGRLYKGLSAGAEVVVHFYDPDKSYEIKKSGVQPIRANPKMCDIQIGQNVIRGEHPHYVVNLSFDDVRLTMTLHSLIRGYKLTDNKVMFGRGPKASSNEWIVIVPRARAHGELTINNHRYTIQGDAYLDHWLGTKPLNVTYDRCHWGKIYQDRYSLIFLRARAEKKYNSRILGFFMLFEDDILLAATDLIDIETLSKEYSQITGHHYPTRFKINVQDQMIQGQIECSSRSVVQAINHVKSHLGKFSFLFPLLKPFVGSPFSYQIVSQANVDLVVNKQPVQFQGIMFHEIDNKR